MLRILCSTYEPSFRRFRPLLRPLLRRLGGMRTRWPPHLGGMLLALALLASPGCFVSEELDRGAQLMDQHSAQPEDVAAPPSTPVAMDRVKDALASAEGWWQSVTDPEPDSNPIVDCRLNGGQAFLVESDCLARGGWVRP